MLVLATVGVLVSTLAIAAGMFVIFRSLGVAAPLTYCLVFSALISPADAVTVLEVPRRASVRQLLRTRLPAPGYRLFACSSGARFRN